MKLYYPVVYAAVPCYEFSNNNCGELEKDIFYCMVTKCYLAKENRVYDEKGGLNITYDVTLPFQLVYDSDNLIWKRVYRPTNDNTIRVPSISWNKGYLINNCQARINASTPKDKFVEYMGQEEYEKKLKDYQSMESFFNDELEYLPVTGLDMDLFTFTKNNFGYETEEPYFIYINDSYQRRRVNKETFEAGLKDFTVK